MKINLPYGRGKTVLDTDIPARVLSTGEVSGADDEIAAVREALANPYGERLAALARGKKNIVVITSDHTRPVPSKVTLPPLLEEIYSGNPDADVTVLVATGLHRETTKDELREKFGDGLYEKLNVVVHDCDAPDLVHIGTLPSGGRLLVNRLAAEADLLVAEGFIEPHFFAGYSGGRKSVLPGVAGRESVMHNHSAAFIDHPRARTGVLEGNPVHADMAAAAKTAKLAFVLNVVLDPSHRVAAAFAGAPEETHAAGCAYLSERCRVSAPEADVVISTNGGYPLDRNIYQAVKGMTAAEAVVKKNGVIIMLAESGDGHGGEGFYNIFARESDNEKILEEIRSRKPEETVPDQWQAQIFARVLTRAAVVYVSSCDDALVRSMHMIPAHNVDEALGIAAEVLGREDFSLNVIPDGVSVICTKEG